MADKFQPISHDAVISILGVDCELKASNRSCLVHEFTQALISDYPSNIQKLWAFNGVAARVLEPGKKWRDGKIRLTIEFCPSGNDEESETEQKTSKASVKDSNNESKDSSPLDDIRQSMMIDD